MIRHDLPSEAVSAALALHKSNGWGRRTSPMHRLYHNALPDTRKFNVSKNMWRSLSLAGLSLVRLHSYSQ
jgi:hypothetical protein